MKINLKKGWVIEASQQRVLSECLRKNKMLASQHVTVIGQVSFVKINLITILIFLHSDAANCEHNF